MDELFNLVWKDVYLRVMIHCKVIDCKSLKTSFKYFKLNFQSLSFLNNKNSVSIVLYISSLDELQEFLGNDEYKGIINTLDFTNFIGTIPNDIHLPNSITKVICHKKNVFNLSVLPETLEHLSILHEEELERDQLPKYLKELVLYCYYAELDGTVLPDGLESLFLQDIRILDRPLPSSLTSLNIDGLDGNLGDHILPSSLKEFKGLVDFAFVLDFNPTSSSLKTNQLMCLVDFANNTYAQKQWIKDLNITCEHELTPAAIPPQLERLYSNSQSPLVQGCLPVGLTSLILTCFDGILNHGVLPSQLTYFEAAYVYFPKGQSAKGILPDTLTTLKVLSMYNITLNDFPSSLTNLQMMATKDIHNIVPTSITTLTLTFNSNIKLSLPHLTKTTSLVINSNFAPNYANFVIPSCVTYLCVSSLPKPGYIPSNISKLKITSQICNFTKDFIPPTVYEITLASTQSCKDLTNIPSTVKLLSFANGPPIKQLIPSHIKSYKIENVLYINDTSDIVIDQTTTNTKSDKSCLIM